MFLKSEEVSKFSWVRNSSISINFSNNIRLRRTLPDSLNFWFRCGNHKANWDIRLPRYFFINLHQRNVELCILEYFYSILRIIEPSIIWLQLNMILLVFELFGFEKCSFLPDDIYWASTSVCFTLPFTLNRIHFPWFWEDLSNEHFFELLHKISEAHPPWPINLFGLGHIFKLLFHSLILFPVISFLAKCTCPNSFITPRISYPDQF